MQCTPINTHSGMPTYYGGPLRHSGSATVVTRQFRVTARYCFLSLVRPLLVLDGDGGSYPCSWPIAHGQKTKTIIVSLSSHSRGRVFVCLGNPGLLDFYVPFLNAIYRSVNSDPPSRSSSSPSSTATTTSVTIFAHAHLGLSSYNRLSNSDKRSYLSWPEKSSVALRAQIQAHLEFLDELLVAYDDDPTTRVLLVGHSIGCWLIQEMLKARANGALRTRVGAYMLFPTISHIVRSPNGRKLSVRISSAAPFPPLF